MGSSIEDTALAPSHPSPGSPEGQEPPGPARNAPLPPPPPSTPLCEPLTLRNMTVLSDPGYGGEAPPTLTTVCSCLFCPSYISIRKLPEGGIPSSDSTSVYWSRKEP